MQKQVIKIKTAWIIFDENRIIDLKNARFSFDQIYEEVKNLYVILKIPPVYKIVFAHYAKGTKDKEKFLKETVAIKTHYTQSNSYQRLYLHDKGEINLTPDEYQEVMSEWKNTSEFVKFGDKIFIEARKIQDVILKNHGEINTVSFVDNGISKKFEI